MRSFRFKKIDAFTGAGSPGNPAGCVYPEDAGMADGDMREIARQLKGFVSEVAYVFREGERHRLRYFSSEREVGFCGHATVAAMFDLFTGGPMAGRGSAEILARGGALTVRYDAGAGGCVFIAAPAPEYLPPAFGADELARALYIESAALDRKYAPAIVRSGLTALLAPMRTAGALTDVKPGVEVLTDFCVKHGLDIVVLYTDDRILPGSRYRTRVFAPRFGYLEDPATGSGNAALGYWLLANGHWDGGPIAIEQGVSYKCPNIVRLMTAQEGGGKAVLFGGSATVRIDGRYILQ